MKMNKVQELDLDRRRSRTLESMRAVQTQLTGVLDRMQLMDDLGSPYLGRRLSEMRRNIEDAWADSGLFHVMLNHTKQAILAGSVLLAALAGPAEAQDSRRLQPGMMPYYDAVPTLPDTDGPRTVYLPDGGTITQGPNVMPGMPPPPVYTPPEDRRDDYHHNHPRRGPKAPGGLRYIP